MPTSSEVTNMAVFCDFENLALGVRDANYDKFDIRRILERLLLKGSIVVKKAYCDWERYKAFKAPMHEANFELIEIPHVRQSGKNSADIRLVVDALDLCYTKEHVDTFVIVSGDSDFSPLVSKLRENAKMVIGVGVKNSTSDLLVTNCDEFIYYDDLVREQRKTRRSATSREAVRGAGKAARDATDGHDAAQAADAVAVPDAVAADVVAAKKGPARGGKAATKAGGAAPASTGRTAATKPVKSATRGKGRPAATADDGAAPAPVAAASSAGAGEATEAGTDPGVLASPSAPESPADPEHRRQAGIAIVVDTLEALSSERGSDRIFGSMIKQAIKRARPQFSESFHGFRSFNAMLEAARAAGVLDLERDEKSGGYVVRLHGNDA